jgi:glycerol kinase
MEVLKAMESDSGIEIKELRVDGGATQNELLLQFQADILKTSVVRPEVTEVTAIGAAYLAGLAVGFWSNIEEIEKQWKINKKFEPGNDNKEDLIKGWYRAIEAVKFWAQKENIQEIK